MRRRECLKGGLSLILAGLLPVARPGKAEVERDHMAQGATVQGRVRDLRNGTWLSEAQFLEQLIAAEAVVIGERHDNPEHHRRERWVINQLAKRERLGGVAMEMLDASQRRALETHSPAAWLAMSERSMRETLEWNPGWDWQAYGPTLQRVFELGISPQPANLAQETIRSIVANNQAPELPAPVAQAQRQALIEGHCHLLPEEQLDGMLAAQVARDRAMAEALDALPAIAVLICGSGHARRDIGVPLHTRKSTLSLGMLEVPPGQDAWEAALPASVDARPPFDLAWLSTGISRGDPCAELRERFAH